MSVTLTPVFALGDRGLIQLPAEIGKLRTSLDRLNALEMPTSRHPLEVADELTELTVQAAHADDLASVDYTTPIRAAEETEAAQHRATAIIAAREAVTNRLQSAVHSNSTVIVTLLQPHFARLIGDLREGLQTAAAWPDPVQALNAPAKVRTKMAAVHSARNEVDSILAARAVLSRLGYRSGLDLEGEFGLCKNFEALWPRQSRQLNPRPPWGDEDKITWWLLNGGDVWLPTMAEQDERYDQVYGEAIRSHARTVAKTRALASQIGGGERIAGPSNNPRPAPTERTTDSLHARLFGDAGSDNEITIQATPAGLVVTP